MPTMSHAMLTYITERIYTCDILVSGVNSEALQAILAQAAALIPETARTIVVEDTPSLDIDIEDTIYLRATRDVAAPRGVSVAWLVFQAARMRPEWIVVGEIEDEAALPYLLAPVENHNRSMTSILAPSPAAAVARLIHLANDDGTEEHANQASALLITPDLIVVHVEGDTISLNMYQPAATTGEEYASGGNVVGRGKGAWLWQELYLREIMRTP